MLPNHCIHLFSHVAIIWQLNQLSRLHRLEQSVSVQSVLPLDASISTRRQVSSDKLVRPPSALLTRRKPPPPRHMPQSLFGQHYHQTTEITSCFYTGRVSCASNLQKHPTDFPKTAPGLLLASTASNSPKSQRFKLPHLFMIGRP